MKTKKHTPLLCLAVVLCGLSFLFFSQMPPSGSMPSFSVMVLCNPEIPGDADSFHLLPSNTNSSLYDLFFFPSKTLLRVVSQKRIEAETVAWLFASYIAASGLDALTAERICSHVDIRFSLHERILSDVIPARAGPMSV